MIAVLSIAAVIIIGENGPRLLPRFSACGLLTQRDPATNIAITATLATLNTVLFVLKSLLRWTVHKNATAPGDFLCSDDAGNRTVDLLISPDPRFSILFACDYV